MLLLSQCCEKPEGSLAPQHVLFLLSRLCYSLGAAGTLIPAAVTPCLLPCDALASGTEAAVGAGSWGSDGM